MNNELKLTPNRSKTYLLPLLSIFINLDKVQNSFLNCYLFDSDNKYKNCIYLLYKYDIKNPSFTSFEYEISKVPGYQTHYDLVDNKVLYIISFPEGYIDEYYYFLDGKYSLFKSDAVDIILSYWTGKLNSMTVNKLKQILTKSSILRKEMENSLKIKISENAELGEIADKNEETINITKHIKNYLC